MNEPKPRGFAAMDPEKRRQIASMGGKAVPPEKRAYTNREIASSAGKIGGSNRAANMRAKRTAPNDDI